MLTTTNKYPFFDLSEVISDPDLLIRDYKRVKPLKAGSFVHGFGLDAEYSKWKRFYNGAETHGPVMLKQFLNNPLVISFYSKHWQQFGLQLLNQLNAIQNEVKVNGGNLLVINAEIENDLNKIAWENSLSLNFYFDDKNEIAELFNIYSETDPLWNKYSGIDVNVPLLATYVINPAKQVIYGHVDTTLAMALPADQVISSVYKSALVHNKKSA